MCCPSAHAANRIGDTNSVRSPSAEGKTASHVRELMIELPDPAPPHASPDPREPPTSPPPPATDGHPHGCEKIYATELASVQIIQGTDCRPSPVGIGKFGNAAERPWSTRGPSRNGFCNGPLTPDH